MSPIFYKTRQKKSPGPMHCDVEQLWVQFFSPGDCILTICPKIQTHTAVAPSCQFPTDTITESVFSLNTEQPKDVNGT